MAGTPDPREGRHLYGHDPQAYDAGRPEYPGEVFDILRSQAGLGPGSRVLEIGPGAGLARRRLLDCGAHVTAVEPNASLARYLRRTIDASGLRIIEAAFEDARLDPGFDLAVAATSWHWVARPAGTLRLRELLRRGGRAVVWWMLFEDADHPDAVSEAIHDRHGPPPGFSPGTRPFQLDTAERVAEFTNVGFTDVSADLIRATVRLGADAARALYASTAVVLRLDDHDRHDTLDVVERIVNEQPDRHLERTMTTAMYAGINPGPSTRSPLTREPRSANETTGHSSHSNAR